MRCLKDRPPASDLFGVKGRRRRRLGWPEIKRLMTVPGVNVIVGVDVHGRQKREVVSKPC